jgi:hypothetical protein
MQLHRNPACTSLRPLQRSLYSGKSRGKLNRHVETYLLLGVPVLLFLAWGADLLVLPYMKDDAVNAPAFAVEQVPGGKANLFCFVNDQAARRNFIQAENRPE